MQIEVGKYYKMRNGGKAFVAVHLPQSPFAVWLPIAKPFIGFADSDNMKVFRWNDGGAHESNCQYDLIAEWREPVTKEVTLYLYRVNNIVHYASSPSENVIGSAKVTLTEGEFA